MRVLEQQLETYSAAELYSIGQNGGISKINPFLLKTTTKVIFSENNLNARINANSQEEIEIEEFNINKVKDLGENEKAVKFLQKIFETEDNLEKILQTLTRLRRVNKCDVLISTPKPEYRKERKERYVGIYFGSEIIHIDLYTK